MLFRITSGMVLLSTGFRSLNVMCLLFLLNIMIHSSPACSIKTLWACLNIFSFVCSLRTLIPFSMQGWCVGDAGGKFLKSRKKTFLLAQDQMEVELVDPNLVAGTWEMQRLLALETIALFPLKTPASKTTS